MNPFSLILELKGFDEEVDSILKLHRKQHKNISKEKAGKILVSMILQSIHDETKYNNLKLIHIFKIENGELQIITKELDLKTEYVWYLKLLYTDNAYEFLKQIYNELKSFIIHLRDKYKIWQNMKSNIKLLEEVLP